MNVLACMGGWCRLRSRCRNYVAPTDRREPVERLCLQGRDVPAPVDVEYEVPINRYEKDGDGVQRLRYEETVASATDWHY
jgi:hypothetical protein